MRRPIRWSAVRLALVLVFAWPLIAAVAGCNRGRVEGGGPFTRTVFPWQGDLGSSAAIAIDSNYIPAMDAWERYDVHRDSVQIALAEKDPPEPPNWGPVPATVRSVLNLGPTRSSKRQVFNPGTWVTIALFDLPPPAVGMPAFPFEAVIQVTIEHENFPDTVFESDFEVRGDQGTPTTLFSPGLFMNTVFENGFDETALEPQPMIRLRAQRGTGLFEDNGWVIGGMEFDLEYESTCINAVRAYPDTEAHFATAIVGPPSPGSPERVHVVVFDMEGFQLFFLVPGQFSIIDPDKAGQGTLLNLAFDQPVTPSCIPLTESDFSIRNLFVTDVNGQPLIDRRGQDSTAFFSYAIIDPT